jgi:hypothetical protein
MKRETAAVETLHERASATPDRKGPAPKRSAAGAVPAVREVASETDGSLRARQIRFARAMTMPESAPGSLDEAAAARWFTAGPRMGALDRLEVYRRAYHARLVDCLRDDYPAVEHALGDDAFEEVCRGYIAAFPSTGPNLNHFGRHMSTFLREGARAASPDGLPSAAVADLADLEWAIVEVIHAPAERALVAEDLQGVPPDAWGDLRLGATPALRLLRFAHPVNRYFQAFRVGDDPSLPGPEDTATVVYRSDATLWRMDLSEPMVRVLSALIAGEPLGAALGRAEALLEGVDEAEVAARVTGWFREWLGHGLFVRANW